MNQKETKELRTKLSRLESKTNDIRHNIGRIISEIDKIQAKNEQNNKKMNKTTKKRTKQETEDTK